MDAVTIISSASLLVVDGNTVKCDGENLRPRGDGAPFVSGFDASELLRYANCKEEIALGLKAAFRMSELLETPVLIVED